MEFQIREAKKDHTHRTIEKQNKQNQQYNNKNNLYLYELYREKEQQQIIMNK